MNFFGRVALTVLLVWTCSPVMGDEGPISSSPIEDVYLFRGVGGYWPKAFGMAAQMSTRGYSPHLYCSLDVPRVTWTVVRADKHGVRGPIQLIGYSLGASAAVKLARNLNAYGIPVERLILIECFDFPQIPPNVRYCVNLYESRPLDRVSPFRGTPARAVDAAATTLVDIDVSRTPEWQDLRRNNHFTMADDPQVQEFVAQQFPDLTSQPSSEMPAGEPAGEYEPFVPTTTDGPTLNAPLPQIPSPAYGYPSSSYPATSAYPGISSSPAAPHGSTNFSYRATSAYPATSTPSAPLGYRTTSAYPAMRPEGPKITPSSPYGSYRVRTSP